MTNERKLADLTIFKTDEDGRKLKNAAFALYLVKDKRDIITPSGGTPWFTYSSNGGVVHTLGTEDTQLDEEILSRGMTDSNGLLSINLVRESAGKQPHYFNWDDEYYLVETSATSDHELPTQAYYFKLRDLLDGTNPDLTLTQNSSSNDKIKIQLNVLNKKKLGTVTLRKYEGNNYGDKIQANETDLKYDGFKLQAGAIFKLVDSKGKTVVNTYDTDEEPIKVNGVALSKNAKLENLTTKWTVNENGNAIAETDKGYLTIENLRWSESGDYYQFVETSAPDGFNTVEIKKFTIGENHTEVAKEAVNPIKTANLTVQKQIDEWNPAFGDATFIFKVKAVKDNNGNVLENQPEYVQLITFDGSSSSLTEETTFTNLHVNYTYQITEIPVSRYVLEKIEAVGSADGSTVYYSDPVIPDIYYAATKTYDGNYVMTTNQIDSGSLNLTNIGNLELHYEGEKKAIRYIRKFSEHLLIHLPAV